MTDCSNDLSIYYLRRHLEILDVEIVEILTKIGTSNDPEGDGYYDAGEYFLGAGLAAVQKYMSETFCILNVEQTKALDAGPILAGGASFANVVWSAANYWKHEAEWWRGAIEIDPQDSSGLHPINISPPIDGKSRSSVTYLKGFGRFGSDYLCFNILAALVDDTEDIRLQSVLPNLEAWRAHLERMGSQ